MRRVLVLVAVAAAVAVWAGVAVPSSALTVNHESVSQSQLNKELEAIDASPLWQCFLQAQAFNNHLTVPTSVKGVPTESWATVMTVEWTNLQTTDLAIEQYVTAHDPAALAAATPGAKASLESAINGTIQTAYASAAQRGQQFSCTAPISSGANVGAEALASMPAWFQDDQITAQAAELALVQLLPAHLPTSGAALEAWYASHSHEFDTVCVSYIVTLDQAHALTAARQVLSGLPFAVAAKRYSKDTSTAPHGGSIGCFSPGSPSYATVLHYVGTVPVGGLSPVSPSPSGQGWLLFTVTKRTAHTFAEVRSAVEQAVAQQNGAAAAVLAVHIERTADVTVSSTIGTWITTLLGGTIVPPSAPPSGAVLNLSANAPPT